MMLGALVLAIACSHPFGLGKARLVAPADGETDVPTDAAVVVHVTDCCVDESGEVEIPLDELLVLRDESGADIPIEVEVGDYWNESYLVTRAATLRAAGGLAPDTRHILLRGNVFVGSFTTGPDPTPELPVPTPEVTVELDAPIGCTDAGELACCAPTELRRIDLVGLSPLLLYTITRVDGGAVIADKVRGDAVGYQLCYYPGDIETAPGLDAVPWIVREQSHIEVAIVAHDAAGRTSPPALTSFPFDCGDQAIPDAPDGCGCRGGAGGAGGAAALALLALTFRPRRTTRAG